MVRANAGELSELVPAGRKKNVRLVRGQIRDELARAAVKDAQFAVCGSGDLANPVYRGVRTLEWPSAPTDR